MNEVGTHTGGTTEKKRTALEELLLRLRKAGLDIDPMAVRDALWLAVQLSSTAGLAPLPAVKPDQPRPQESSNPGARPVDPGTGNPVRSPPKPITIRDLDDRERGDSSMGVVDHPATAGERDVLPASALRIPAADALANKLPIARSLRPLGRRRAAPQIQHLDEDATVDATSRNAGLLIPILRSANELWYDLVLVADASASMDVWQDTLREFLALTRTAGVFRDVHSFRLHWTAEGPLLRTPEGKTGQSAETIAQTNLRRIILFATNGTGDAWSNGRVGSLIKIWSQKCSVAVLQMLPETLWTSTQAGRPTLLLRTLQPGATAAALQPGPLWWDDELADSNDLSDVVRSPSVPIERLSGAVPVLPLDAAWIERWARMQMGDGEWTPGIRIRSLPVASPTLGAFAATSERTPEAWEDLTRAFVGRATSDARSLAVYLSGGSFTLPVARLVQEVKLGRRASQSQLAEVLLSGLAERTTPADSGIRPDWIEYRFHPEAAQILRRGLRDTDREQIVAALSAHIEQLWGKPVDFAALIADPGGLEKIPAYAQPFARLGQSLYGSIVSPPPPEGNGMPIFLSWESEEWRPLALRIAASLTERDFPVNIAGTHEVPPGGVALTFASFPRPSTRSDDSIRVIQNGLNEIVVSRSGEDILVSPPLPSAGNYSPSSRSEAPRAFRRTVRLGANLSPQDQSDDESILEALVLRINSFGIERLPEVSGAPAPNRLRQDGADELNRDIFDQVTAGKTIIFYTNENFDAVAAATDLIWDARVRRSFPSGLFWSSGVIAFQLSLGALTVVLGADGPPPQEPGPLVLIDPSFAALPGEGASVYEGPRLPSEIQAAHRSRFQAFRPYLAAIIIKSPHLTHVAERLSQVRHGELLEALRDRKGTSLQVKLDVVALELRMRTRMLESLPPQVNEVVGIVAALGKDPALIRALMLLESDHPMDLFEEFKADLIQMDLLDATERTTWTAVRLASSDPRWPQWNAYVIQNLGINEDNWMERATEETYIRQNLIRLLFGALNLDVIERIIYDFRFWDLRITNDGAEAFFATIADLTKKKVFSSLGRLLQDNPGFASQTLPEIARRIRGYDFPIGQTLRDTASEWLERATAPIEMRRSILIAGPRIIEGDTIPNLIDKLLVEAALNNCDVVCGNHDGTDATILATFANVQSHQRDNDISELTIVDTIGRNQKVNGDRVHIMPSTNLVADAVALADCVVLLGGNDWVSRIAVEAQRTGRSLFPLPQIGRAAERIYGEERFDHPRWAEALEIAGPQSIAQTLVAAIRSAPAIRTKTSRETLSPGGFPRMTMAEVAGPSAVFFNDDPEDHGPFVATRGNHIVQTPPRFRIGEFLVTNRQFSIFAERDYFSFVPSSALGNLGIRGTVHPLTAWLQDSVKPGFASHPIRNINFFDAQAFIGWMEQKFPEPGWRWCLPTEDMWELAARSDAGLLYPWGNQFEDGHCNSISTAWGNTTPVTDFPLGRSRCGCHDMAGNVWEFVDDGASSGAPQCVMRGGSYKNTGEEVKSTLRLTGISRDYRELDFGMRCAQVPDTDMPM